jgi:hypothetical protein
LSARANAIPSELSSLAGRSLIAAQKSTLAELSRRGRLTVSCVNAIGAHRARESAAGGGGAHPNATGPLFVSGARAARAIGGAAAAIERMGMKSSEKLIV